MGGDVVDGVAGSAGAFANRLRDVALADSGRADEQHVLLSLDEVASGEIDDLRFRDLGVEGPVEVLEPLGALEVGATHTQVELFVLPALDLVGAQPEEELAVAEARVHRFLDAEVEGLKHPRQAQLLENGDEIVRLRPMHLLLCCKDGVGRKASEARPSRPRALFLLLG